MNDSGNNRPSDHVVAHASILRRAIRQSVILSVLTIILLSVSAFFIAKSQLERRVLAQLSSLAAAKEDLIEEVLQHDRERTALLAQQPSIVATMLNGDTGALEEVMSTMREEGVGVLGITIFNIENGPLIRTGAHIDAFVPVTSTQLFPHIGVHGWDGHTVIAPMRNENSLPIGYLAMRYEARGIVASLTDIPTLGDSGEVMLGASQSGELLLLQHKYAPNAQSPIFLGNLQDQIHYNSTLALAVIGKEGLGKFEDYKGNTVYAAYRNIPTLGWGLVVKMDTDEALQGVIVLAKLLTVLGTILFLATSILAYAFGMRLTNPLLALSKKMGQLKPGHWEFEQSIHTGDEVELLDTVAADLTQRLSGTYEYLEDEISARAEELRQQSVKDRTILETIHHGVVVVDTDGRVSDANTAAGELLGHDSTKDLLGKKVTDIMDIRVHQKEQEGGEHPVRQCLETGDVVQSRPDVRYSIVRSDYTILPVTLIVTPLQENNEYMGAVAVFQDMTEERRVDYVKSEFISLASHQLRTPLSTLKWYIELLGTEEGSPLSDNQHEYLNEMMVASRRMTSLVDTLLHAARLEGGGIQPEIKDVKITALLRDMSEELCTLAKDSKVACAIKLPPADITIATDPILMHIVFQNLMENAVKYSGEGGQVDILLEETKDTVRISVKDTGIGIPKNDQPRVFEKLFRASNVLKHNTDGNGLGLYITKLIVDNLKGDISFVSEEEKGSTFTVELPKVIPKEKTE